MILLYNFSPTDSNFPFSFSSFLLPFSSTCSLLRILNFILPLLFSYDSAVQFLFYILHISLLFLFSSLLLLAFSSTISLQGMLNFFLSLLLSSHDSALRFLLYRLYISVIILLYKFSSVYCKPLFLFSYHSALQFLFYRL